jgi:alpha-ketoglutarate-dependent taurine dioxygenase
MAGQSLLKHCSFTPDTLRIDWVAGGRTEIASLWLRDNCPGDRDLQNGQRLLDITDLPEEPRIRSASPRNDAIVIEWVDDAPAASFDLEWLASNAPGRGQRRSALPVKRWLGGATLDASRDFAWLPVDEFRSVRSLRRDWMTRLLQEGIAFLSGVPSTANAILEAVAPLGLVLDTNYGRVFDVRSLPQPENLAYSDRGLGLHTDNPYRDPVPGFQALHCLVASHEGGDSVFADGLAIAEHLREAAPDSFATLTRTAVPFHYRSKDAELYSEKPLIQVSIRGEVTAIHYNNRSIAPLQLAAGDLRVFYAAYRRFAALLRDARFQVRTRLRDGDLVVLDNQRTLHGRMAFSSERCARHLQGCYLARDSVLSETALLQRQVGRHERT